MRYDVEDDEKDDEILSMSTKELREFFGTYQFPLSGKKVGLVSCVRARLESISFMHGDSLDYLDWIFEDNAWLNLNLMSAL